ncbi:TolC family protein [Hymenobacter sp. 15J16-1T3B]|uniref:TolC family protein n=1 Tax=Hymenobacter sp. 15J16-1T3B TaxID=2886941 RepID=UPI001D1249CD|nr:TolC family protein [Hymenobacter sp. 15J16-1T3B]MCC3159370.1 TolC family protein [Hymenobacter sp. 15J16-1T3B]
MTHSLSLPRPFRRFAAPALALWLHTFSAAAQLPLNPSVAPSAQSAGASSSLPAQAPVAAAPAQNEAFTLADLLTMVGENHPVARQAALQPERARQEVRLARGLLDPMAESKFYRKEFGGKDYWNLWDNTLRVPTWYGPDVKLGYERNVGPRVSEQTATPGAGLTYVGLSLPLAQGLLIDERRAAVRQAQALQGLAEAERRAALNKLLLAATKDYWNWTLAHQRRQLMRGNLELADVRYRAVRERVRLGDLAAIDSVEALTELQNRRAQLVQGEVEWQNATLVLSTYLWDAELRPRELPVTVLPQPLPPAAAWTATPAPAALEQLVEQARQQHPELLKTRAKLEALDVERRLYQNKLLPKLSVDYNVLLTGRPYHPETGYGPAPLYQNNYKMGVSFAYPLLLRQERSKLQLNRLKIQEATLGLDQASREVATAVRTTANDQQALAQQLQAQEQVVLNSQRLRDGEQIRFENGESSVFLLNSRESYLLTARLKLAELQAKYAQTQAGLRFAAGAAPTAE